MDIFKTILRFGSFLIAEFVANGKLLAGYIITEFPTITGHELSEYPGLLDAIQGFATHPDNAHLFRLAFQVFLAGAAGHRLFKVLLDAASKFNKQG